MPQSFWKLEPYLRFKLFTCLLSRNNKETVYGLLGSHGDTEHLVYLAEVLQDTEKVIQYNIR